MEQLILHGIGDYFIQSDKWALGKKDKGIYGLVCCLKHCITYSLPFLFIGSWQAVVVIFITHFIIDRTNIVTYLLAVKNNVKYSKVDFEVSGKKGYNRENFGFGVNRPFAITIWLYIICDNLVHIICNYLALKYL